MADPLIVDYYKFMEVPVLQVPKVHLCLKSFWIYFSFSLVKEGIGSIIILHQKVNLLQMSDSGNNYVTQII